MRKVRYSWSESLGQRARPLVLKGLLACWPRDGGCQSSSRLMHPFHQSLTVAFLAWGNLCCPRVGSLPLPAPRCSPSVPSLSGKPLKRAERPQRRESLWATKGGSDTQHLDAGEAWTVHVESIHA